MKLNKIKTSLLFFILVFILAAISSKDSALLEENAFDVAELFAADEDIGAGDVVVLAYTAYGDSAAASALGLEQKELKEVMEKEGAANPLDIAEELEDAEKTGNSSFDAVSGNAVNELGLEEEAIGNETTEQIASEDADAIIQKIKRRLNEKKGYTGSSTGKDELLASKAAVVALTNVQNDANIIGVVSSKPAFIMGFGSELRNVSSVPVALAGRVPVKVSLENGEIKAGDALTSSTRKGYAAKAVKSGRIIGYAMEDYKTAANTEKIMVFVQPGWHQSEESVIAQAPSADLGYQKINGSVIIRLG